MRRSSLLACGLLAGDRLVLNLSAVSVDGLGILGLLVSLLLSLASGLALGEGGSQVGRELVSHVDLPCGASHAGGTERRAGLPPASQRGSHGGDGAERLRVENAERAALLSQDGEQVADEEVGVLVADEDRGVLTLPVDRLAEVADQRSVLGH